MAEMDGKYLAFRAKHQADEAEEAWRWSDVRRAELQCCMEARRIPKEAESVCRLTYMADLQVQCSREAETKAGSRFTWVAQVPAHTHRAFGGTGGATREYRGLSRHRS